MAVRARSGVALGAITVVLGGVTALAALLVIALVVALATIAIS